MPISDVLVYVDDAPSWPGRIEAAVALARHHDAHLIGLGVKAPIPPVFTADGGAYGLISELEAMRERELKKAEEQFDRAMRESGYSASSEWRAGAGDPVMTIALHARYADVTIVSQGDPEADDIYNISLPGDLTMSSGRPTLVIPYVGARQPIGRNILIAWNGSREAARAVSDAMAFLQDADSVHVLTVSERGIHETAGPDLARFLTRHGIRAETENRPRGEANAADTILNVAMERGSDLLVTGCYGHSRLREAMFGGVSRSLFRSMTVPILMGH
jgi:nucleotide-binding universal stress UspA family protein